VPEVFFGVLQFNSIILLPYLQLESSKYF